MSFQPVRLPAGTADLPPYAARLVLAASARSDYPFVINPDHGPTTRYGVHIGRQDQPFHIVCYPPEKSEHQTHFLVSAAAHVLRFWDVPPSYRVTPVMTDHRLPEQDHADLIRACPDHSKHEIDQLSRTWYRSVVGAATSLPLSLRIEEDLYREIPQHRPRQLSYLRMVLEQCDSFIQPDWPDCVPPRCARALTALTTAYMESVMNLTNLEPGSRYKKYADLAMIAPMLETMSDNLPGGFAGDITLTDAWAQTLGIRQWYRWEPLD